VRLDEARCRVGAGVVYNPGHGEGAREDGVITAVNALYVFVRYRGERLTLLVDR